MPARLWHYTDEQGQRSILESRCLLPSLKDGNPKDARYGDGQYLSDVHPGTMSAAQLARCFVRVPWLSSRFTHYIEVDVTGLELVLCRRHVILVPGREPLALEGRIVCWGVNEWLGT
ncbi:hypothetical protein GCM10009678_47590 [Actinomadura kijaniata]|uniref:Tox-ART-HYD1 domain-containing protein n=1 Tax=Actinomadura namibiensis TaxID=182080 RepID=A0A7W3QK24_ACTNM|nr:hypothetical protein [Actinomadura namibiensis]